MIDKNVLFIGNLSQEHCKDGYTNAGNGMLSVLLEMKKRKLLKNVEAINLSNIYQNQLILKKYDIVILIMNPFFLNNQGNLEILTNLKNHTKDIYLQVVWETDSLPSHWNWIWTSDIFSGFIAPSLFMEKLLKNKTKKPVYYIPHYIDIEKFSKADLNKKSKENIFTVLSLGQWTKRKGLEDAIVAFSRALGQYSDCRLIVKYSGMKDINQDNIEGQIRNIAVMNCSQFNSSILISGEDASYEELLDLYSYSSVLLFPSRGEGFGLPVAEAMSVGIPVIYTAWSALPEIASAKGNIPVKFLLDESVGMSQFGYEKGSKYAVPFMADLIKAIEIKYLKWKENRQEYYEDTNNNNEIINERFGVEKIIDCLTKFME